jgi:hypothetical protein
VPRRRQAGRAGRIGEVVDAPDPPPIIDQFASSTRRPGYRMAIIQQPKMGLIDRQSTRWPASVDREV